MMKILILLLLLPCFLQAQYLSTTQRKQVSKLIQDSIAPLKLKIAALEAKLIVTDAKATTSFARATTTETTANKNAKAITIIQTQVSTLQKLDTVKATGSIKIARIGTTSQLQFSNDSATATKAGNLTPFYLKTIKDLRAEVTALKAQATSFSKQIAKIKIGVVTNPNVKEQTDSVYIIIPQKKKLAILIK